MLTKLFEHNNWANDELLAACAALSEEQLDAAPDPATEWSLRHTLSHLVEAQRAYLALLTLPPEQRQAEPLSSGELRDAARASGEGLLALARDAGSTSAETRVRTTDGHVVAPWVVMLQTINHATEHRRQISGMLRALGVTPPTLDGWSFGEFEGALVPPV